MQLVKMLTSKTKISEGCREAYGLCVDLWDELSSAVVGSQGSSLKLPSRDDLQMRDSRAIVRLALLADFYRYLEEDLELNREESAEKLCAVRAKASEILESEEVGGPPVSSDHSLNKSYSPASLTRSRAPRGGSAPKLGPRAAWVHGSTKRRKVGFEDTKEKYKNVRLEKRPRYRGENCVRWSKLCFSTCRKSYYTKLVKAFHVVKNTGYPMLMLCSEWGLSCYYKLAVAYTTDQPLELSAECIPELRQAVDVIHSEHFQKLRELKPECQVLLYAVLNCHINWVDRNHKQILIVPGQPSASSAPVELDLRCSQCLKNQTFRSSEVKGNPRNIDVEFDFEQMKFGSSCCAAPMINVPLSTRDVNTCTFTEMKQMYTCCPKCKQPIFSEVLVDMETLYLRCAACTGL